MNYIIEDNINFYEELNKDLSNTDMEIIENSDEEKCLITHLDLEENHIKLSCNHKFNIIPLYKEVCKQKYDLNKLETTCLLIFEIKCPYCRTITDKLLPYIPNSVMEIKRGVNYPFRYCLKIHECEWKIRSGKNKNENCGKSAFKSEHGLYCKYHYKKIDFNKKNDTKICDLSLKTIDDQYLILSTAYTLKCLKGILKQNNLKVSGTKLELIKRIGMKGLL